MIKRREFKFAHHLPENDYRKDTHIVKVHDIDENNNRTRHLITIENFTRPFWITKPFYRTHKDKREFESLKKVKKFFSTESQLINSVARALGRDGYKRNNRRDVENSPYVYGLDIKSTVFLKKMFMDKMNGRVGEFVTAGLDVETNAETDELYIITVAMENKIRTFVTKDFLNGQKDAVNKIQKLAKEHLPDNIYKDLDIVIEICDNELDAVIGAINKLHEWKPDFVMIWNILFDIGIIQKVCDRYNYPVRILFKDPSLSDALAVFKIKEGQKTKTTSSGKETPVPVHQRWNVVTTSSSFYLIDGMTVFNYVRQGEKLVPGGYGLDNLLTRIIGFGKLKMIETDRIGKEWHDFMQERHPLEYIVYNIWDTYGMIKFNEETKDLIISMPTLADVSDFDYFHSGPKKNVDGLLFYALENMDKVLMTRGNEPIEGNLTLKDWIATLDPKFLTTTNAMNYTIKENNESS